MSVLNCDRHGAVESVGPCCLLCGGCGDEDPPRCPELSEVVKVVSPLGYRGEQREPTTLLALTHKRCSACGAAMYRWPNTFEWRCDCGEIWLCTQLVRNHPNPAPSL